MKKHIYLFLSLALLAFGSCDIIERPFVELPPGACAPSQDCLDQAPADPFAGQTITRKVMLEEFTGHQCGNCPAASEVALKLRDETYKDRMYLVTVHAGQLARWDSADSKFNVNYTTADGNEYFDYFFPGDAVPFGLVNRTESANDFFLYPQSAWESAVEAELQKPAEVGIHITPCYDPATRELISIVDIKYLMDATAEEYISLFLIEDKVVGWQKDYRLPSDDENIPDYEHHDMFRTSLNGTWGQPLSSEQVLADATFRVTNCYTVPDHINADNIKVVAFIHDFETRAVRQVEVVKVN
jgi:hypothetical protein